jgi:hypothetical protein
MRMSKAKAEELLEYVKERLKEAKQNAQESNDEVDALRCSKAYLEFILTGLEKNPSIKTDLGEDED